ncbi:MAG: hypothetical protein FJZ15_07705, partial [Candidatus Omnitrophica bacterium]|nr:hypothetical protein [Candidatus Omnitrophota bacterium]
MKKKNLNKAAKIISGVFLCLAAVFIARASIVTIKQISYFNIKKVITNIAEADKFSYFKGKGIFSLDLKKEAQSIAFSHPDYKAIRIVRILPDKLYIDFIRRAPLARVKLYRPFFVDSGSFLFDMPVDAQPPDLPLITGLDTKIFGPKPGRRYNNVSELSLALSAIKEIKKNRAFLWYRIKEINVTSPLNMDIILAFRKGAQ